MKSNNATESDIRRALSAQLSPLLPTEGWERNVLAEMARKKRRRLRMRWLVGASVAAAVALLVVAVPSENPVSPEDSEFIYSREYYAALPRPERPISVEVDRLISDVHASSSDYFEPYTPLPL